MERLRAKGYEAYLVGGCVRDLLIGLKPKDFDIATAALPREVKRVFPRNCRVIGRRFKLAHLHFNGNTKILEAATFRRTPEGLDDDSDEDDLLIVRDNVFGTAEEDAVRRDFTVNALFFDPLDDRIIDYVGGLADVRARLIRTIGDPEVRFREDPVRILRAAKFAGRLGFAIDKPTHGAMKLVATDLTRAAPPRLLEEILRLLRGGHALDSFQILRDVQALPVILPVVGDYLAAAAADERVLFWRTLESLDNRIARGDAPSNPVLLGALFNRPVLALAAQVGHSPTTVAEEVLGPFSLALRLPRRDAGCLKRICGVQTRFTSTGRRRFRLSSFLRDAYFPQALELFELSCRASGEGLDQLQRWRQLYADTGAEVSEAEVSEGEVSGSDAEAADTAPTAGAAAGAGPDERRKAGRKKRRRRRKKKTPAGGGMAPAEVKDEDKDEDKDQQDSKGQKAQARKPKARKKRTRDKEVASKEADTKETGSVATEDAASKGNRKRRRKRARTKKTPATEATANEKTTKNAAARKKRKRGRGPRQDDVKTVEPEPVDISAFDVELGPKRVPTFTTIVEGQDQPTRKRRRPRVPGEETDTYKPPPPPGTDKGDEPPPPDDDVFGDW